MVEVNKAPAEDGKAKREKKHKKDKHGKDKKEKQHKEKSHKHKHKKRKHSGERLTYQRFWQSGNLCYHAMVVKKSSTLYELEALGHIPTVLSKDIVCSIRPQSDKPVSFVHCAAAPKGCPSRDLTQASCI